MVQKPEEESKAKVEGKTNASENRDLGRRRCRKRARSAALRSCHLEIAAALSAACSDLRSSEERRDLFSGFVRACVGAIVEYKCGRCRSTFAGYGKLRVAVQVIEARGGCWGDKAPNNATVKPNRPACVFYRLCDPSRL